MTSSGYEALRNSAAWIDLSARGKIRVTGDDRARLLHAMCTNHVQELPHGDGLYAFFLNAQGRILADAYVYHLDELILLDTEPETVTRLIEHLEKYIIADDVALENETAQWTCIGLEGPGSLGCATKMGIPLPKGRYCLCPWRDGFIVNVASSANLGLRIFLPRSRRDELLALIEREGLPQADDEAARVVRIENGKARYSEDITERYLVQETQALHGVHFSKGCYLGQEIVERVRSRGQVHRLLTPLRLKTTTPPPPGTKLSLDGKDVAELTSAAYSPALQEVVALGYVRSEVVQEKPLLTITGATPAISAYIPNGSGEAGSPKMLP